VVAFSVTLARRASVTAQDVTAINPGTITGFKRTIVAMTNYSKAERGFPATAQKMPPMTGVFIGLALCVPFWAVVAMVLT
jgi:hypothetical protein